MNKIVITLTTIPSRLVSNYTDGINSCIDSLLNQTYTNYELHLNIPHVLKITNEPYVIPESISNISDERFKIFRTDDWGAATKIIPTVERVTDPETIIIVVDDDMVYHKELVGEHLKNRVKWPESVVGYDGMRGRDNLFSDIRNYYFSGTHKNSRVDILQHYKSVSYLRRFFEEDFFPFAIENLTWNDDLLFAAYFSLKKRDRICTYYENDVDYVDFHEWEINVGTTFPIVRNTQHDSVEGCNLSRRKNIEDNSANLFKNFIDHGYENN